VKIYIDTKLCVFEGHEIRVVKHSRSYDSTYPLSSFKKKYWGCEKCRNLHEVETLVCTTSSCRTARPDDWEMTIKTLEVWAGRIICSE